MKDIVEGQRGKQIILSRSDATFVQKLFEREVPEMSSGSVEIKVASREAGVRTKIAVFSNQSGVDPVGSCVGQKGVRVQAVTNELGGERVDIIPFTEDVSDLIKASLSPAENLSVTLNEDKKIAVVKAPEDQLSLAIGKDGQNARLAAKLTGWKIEIKEIKGEKKEKEKLGKEGKFEKKAERSSEPESESEKVEKKEKKETGSKKTKVSKKTKKTVKVKKKEAGEEEKTTKIGEKIEDENTDESSEENNSESKDS